MKQKHVFSEIKSINLDLPEIQSLSPLAILNEKLIPISKVNWQKLLKKMALL